MLAVALAFTILIGLGYLIGKQVADLTANLPQYQAVISKKIENLRTSNIGKDVVEKAADALEGLNSKFTQPAPQATAPVALPKTPANTVPGSFRSRCINRRPGRCRSSRASSRRFCRRSPRRVSW